MIAFKVPAEGARIEVENTSETHSAFVDFERHDLPGHERRITLGPKERKPMPLLAGTVYITTTPGVLVHGVW